MKKAAWNVVMTAAAVLVFTGTAAAQAGATATGTVNVSMNVNARAKLSFDRTNVTFSDRDPDAFSTIDATPLDVTVKARTGSASVASLTVLASGDLTGTGGTIPVGQLSWTGTGSLVGGTASGATAQTVGSWTGSGNRTEQQTYSLVNSWDYATGSYSVTMTYTLTVP
jgi:hypothetical protein